MKDYEIINIINEMRDTEMSKAQSFLALRNGADFELEKDMYGAMYEKHVNRLDALRELMDRIREKEPAS